MSAASPRADIEIGAAARLASPKHIGRTPGLDSQARRYGKNRPAADQSRCGRKGFCLDASADRSWTRPC
jgi:hypothetical protein